MMTDSLCPVSGGLKDWSGVKPVLLLKLKLVFEALLVELEFEVFVPVDWELLEVEFWLVLVLLLILLQLVLGKSHCRVSWLNL